MVPSEVFILRNNMLQGSLPFPPPSILNYDLLNNKLSEEVSPLFCNLSSIQHISLGYNKLSGMLPKYLKNLSNTLLALSLVNNSFHGRIHEICQNGSQLKMIDRSYNMFEGYLSQSFHSCLKLQFLNLVNNQLRDTFPFWLGTLSDLKVLMLRSNHLHGVIGRPISNCEFPNIRVVDQSYNNFSEMASGDNRTVPTQTSRIKMPPSASHRDKPVQWIKLQEVVAEDAILLNHSRTCAVLD
nr:receptor like protein 27-like [Ziziphus jujuba var. spinosa]